MTTIPSFVRTGLFPAVALGVAVLSTPANACVVCGGIKLNGPILNGPIFQGPILQGPILQGPVIQGPIVQGPLLQGPMLQGAAAHGTQTGRVVSVTLPNGITVPVR